MNLELTDDQRMLKDMLDRFVADTGGVEPHRAAARADHGWSPKQWREMVELGLPAMLLDEAQGGLAGGGTELMLAGEALGRGLVASPYLETAVLAAPLLARAGGDAAAEALASLIDGSRIFALVTAGGVAASEGRLSGVAHVVPGADGADALIVAVAGEDVYLVAADAAGLTRTGYPTHGGGGAADLHFEAVAGNRILRDNAAVAIADAEARRITYLAARALGLASYALDTTVEYLKTRIQFGTPIGTNQSLQHRGAEMYVELEQLRSATILAACMLDDPDRAERERALVAVAAVVAKAARFIGQQTVQLHGGIGVTDEHAIGHCFLNLTAIGIALGGVDANVARLGELGGFVSGDPYWTAGR